MYKLESAPAVYALLALLTLSVQQPAPVLNEFVEREFLLTNSEENPFKGFKVSGFEFAGNSTPPQRSAKLCLARIAHPDEFLTCHDTKSSRYSHPMIDSLAFQDLTFGDSSTQGVLFTVAADYGGSGTIRLVTLWTLCTTSTEHSFGLCNRLPEILVTEQGEYMFAKSPVTGGTIFLLANYVWEKDETHFDPHYFRIEAYEYSATGGMFEKVVEYRTQTKYGCFDDPTARCPLESEMDSVFEQLEP